jgi:hypothetical protein
MKNRSWIIFTAKIWILKKIFVIFTHVDEPISGFDSKIQAENENFGPQ